ncbi:Guanine nucleotide exchange protein smcr8 [Dissophora globulifera]|nr:Guanine nucleotide exchange protein smcr8 [Dissophora globulifera]
MLSLPRSASTSQIDATSPTPHFETTGSRPHQRTPGVVSYSEAGSTATLSQRQPPSFKPPVSSEPAVSGLKAPPSSVDGPLLGTGVGFRGLQAGQAGLSLDPPSSSWWFTKKSAALPDFVLISEFSEVEGPRAVMTIPDNIVDLTRDSYSSQKQRAQESTTRHAQESSDASTLTLTAEGNGTQDIEDKFDIHEFVLRITSVDQQARETSGIFHIPEDIEVHVSDAENGYWAYVHHFTLFDINARGFVRPFSISYITRDPHKVLAHFDDMRRKFSSATLYFKTGNYTLFRQDLTKKLRDLNYTNNLLSEAPADASSSPSLDTSTAGSSRNASLPSKASQSTLTNSSSEPLNLSSKSEYGPAGALSEQQQADLDSIKDAIETATHIISALEHYSIDGQPLLGHAEEGHEGPHSMAPLSDISPMTSSENLAMLTAGRAGPTDSSLFLGASSRPGSRIHRKSSTPNVSGARILDAAGPSSILSEGYTTPLLPHLLGLQQDQPRKNSVVSEYDMAMYETPEYIAQYVTSLYPVYRDEVVFRPLRELCIANMVWNSSIQFHLGVKKIKDILREFQADLELLGDAADNLKRMRPTGSSVTIGQRFLINLRNPDFNRFTASSTQHHEAPVPLVELVQEISLANATSDDAMSTQELLLPEIQDTASTAAPEPAADAAVEERRVRPTIYADDADDEQTGYDSLDDAASFFTAATGGVVTHTDTPTRDAFLITPLDRSARVVEWHQEQQTLHHAKGATNVASSQGVGEQMLWTFGAGASQGDQTLVSGTINRAQHRQSGQSGTSTGIVPTNGLIQTTSCPTLILDTLQKDPTLTKHLVFALLSGQKVCIMGQSESEGKVRALVSVLATFLPHAGYPSREEQLIEHQRQTMTWYQGHGLLQVEDMERLDLVGVDSGKIDPTFLESNICIVDYDTFTWVNGRQYTDGIFLEPIFRNLSLFSEDASFLAFLDGKLFEILLKSFLYYHLVFHGRLYQGGLLSHPGAQAFYSSGASDDGEAFSYQHNFRSSRPSPASPRTTAFARLARRNTSTYLGSTQFGEASSYKNANDRSASLSSQESSDAEKPMTGHGDTRRTLKSEQLDSIRRRLYEKGGQERFVMSGDETFQSGAPMQYTTSQGMRKWKKWFEYWSAKSAAMIDPALAAFGRSDSTGPMEGMEGGEGRRKRNSSRRSSPHRRPKAATSRHNSPGRSREARDREKERDRERDRERNRKSTFDSFDVHSKRDAMPSSSDSESNSQYNDMSTFKRGVLTNEKGGIEYLETRSDGQEEAAAESRIDESHVDLAEGLAPSSKSSSGLRRLKPKRPLILQRVTSKLSDVEREKNGRAEEKTGKTGGESLKRPASPESTGSPPSSATFRSFAGAIRAMSFGHTSSSTTAIDGVGHLDAPARSSGRQSLEGQNSPRSSKELSDPNHKELKRRESKRAKAKAWLKSKRKRRSRVYDDEQAEQDPDNLDEQDEDLSEDDQGTDKEDQDLDQTRPLPQLPQEANDSEMTVRLGAQSAPPTASSTKSLVVPAEQSQSSIDLTEAVHSPIPGLPSEVPLTIQEMAAQEPTRIQPQAIAPTPLSALNNGNNISRVSSASPSRITSPTLVSFSAGHHQRLDIASGTRSLSRASMASSPSAVSLAGAAAAFSHEARSELEDSECDRRRDLGRESATEYETSLETFVTVDNGHPVAFGGSRSGRRQSVESLTRSSMDGGSGSKAQPSSSLQQVQEQQSQKQKVADKQVAEKDETTVTLTEEEEAVVREMLGGVTGSDDWSIVVHLATMVDEYERSKKPVSPAL